MTLLGSGDNDLLGHFCMVLQIDRRRWSSSDSCNGSKINAIVKETVRVCARAQARERMVYSIAAQTRDRRFYDVSGCHDHAVLKLQIAPEYD